jgi:hypothetical protein
MGGDLVALESLKLTAILTAYTLDLGERQNLLRLGCKDEDVMAIRLMRR